MHVVPLPVTPPNEEVIRLLEEMLERARNMPTSCVVIAMRNPEDRTTDVFHTGASTPEVLGTLIIAQDVVLKLAMTRPTEN